MNIKDHVVVSYSVFGGSYDEVHKWLDGDAKNWLNTPASPYRHWRLYHNRDAIDERYPIEDIRRVVAYLHVLTDWLCHFGLWNLPENSEEVEQLLRELQAWW